MEDLAVPFSLSIEPGPPRNEEVFQWTEKAQTSRLVSALCILLLFGGIFFTQLNYANRDFHPQVQCCSLHRPLHSRDTGSLQWDGALNAGNCTLEVCFTSGWLKSNGDTLSVNLVSGSGQVAFTVSLVFAGLTLVVAEFTYLQLVCDSQACLLLLSYGLYVGMNKRKYVIGGIVLCVGVIITCAARILLAESAATDLVEDVEGTDVYLSCGHSAMDNPSLSVLKTVALVLLSYQGFAMAFWKRMTDFYCDIKFKKLLLPKSDRVFQSLHNLTKVEMHDVETCLSEGYSWLGKLYAEDIGRLVRLDKVDLEVVIAKIYAQAPTTTTAIEDLLT